MKKLSLILNIAIFSLAGFIALCFSSGLIFRFSNYIFPDQKSELIFLAVLIFIGFIIFLSMIVLVFCNNTEFKTEKQKLYLFLYIMACSLIFLTLGSCRNNRYLPDVLASVKNFKKAAEIMNFLKDEPINITKANDKYLIISYRGYVKDNNELLIKLAENGLIDNNFIKDNDFEKIKSKYYYDKKIKQPERLKKYVEYETRNQIKYINGVKKVKVDFIPSLNGQNSKFTVNVQVSDDSESDKIRKTIDALLFIYPGENKIINITKLPL